VYGHNPKHTEANDGVAFATTGNTNEAEKKSKKDRKKNITCFKCKKNGHYLNECPDDEEKNKNGSSFLVLNTQDSSDDESGDDDTNLTISHDNITAVQGGDSSDEESVEDTEEGDTYDEDLESEEPETESEDDDYGGFVFTQKDVLCSMQDRADISSSWILLDSQSTVDVFSNPKLLSNIHDTRPSLTLYCNAGKATINKKGDLKGYGTVWYHPDGIANILSLHNVQKKYKVTYDSAQGNGFMVHKANDNNRVFMPSSKGLFYSDVKNDVAHVLINTEIRININTRLNSTLMPVKLGLYKTS